MKKTFFTLLTCISTFIYGQVTSGLVAKYSFNNGNANDEVGTVNGVVNGAVLTTDRFGNPNKAYKFISNDYIAFPNSSSLKSPIMTISLWVKVDSLASSPIVSQDYIYSVINSKTNNYFSSFCMSIATNTHKYFSVNQNNSLQSAYGYSSNSYTSNWQHYVLAISNNSIKMYLDNVLQFNQSKNFTTTFTSDSVYIGQSGNTSYKGFLNGSVDDLRIYNKVLSDIEVDSLFHESNTSLGVEEFSGQVSIQIYPNPTSDQIYISDFFDIIITDELGRVIASEKSSNYVDLSKQPSGFYFMTLSSPKTKKTIAHKKLIKE